MKAELNELELENINGGMSEQQAREKLFKVGDMIDNGSGYFYKIVRIVSIDCLNIDNSTYDIEVYFLRNHYEYNDTRTHKELSRYTLC